MRVACCRVAFAAACFVLAGCRPDAEPADTEPAAVEADSVFDPPESRVSLPSDRIYYTLTNYDWYARGEPLVHEGSGYRTYGMPVSASAADMTKAGEYHGVEYYTLDDDTTQTVYVPVFQGYWQGFRLDPSAPVPLADTTPTVPAAPQNADSAAAPADSAGTGD